MAAPEGFPNLTNAGKGRKKGAKNKYTLYQEEAIQKYITEENLLIRWIKKLDEKVMNDKIRPEAIASSYEKVAKHIVRTASDQEILDNVFVDTENDIEQDGNEILADLNLIETLRKK